MNLGKAHQKARAAMKRREEQIEQDELEGGEINLIPYLDIVTNLMLFLLASISSGLILGQINTTLPDKKTAAPSTDLQPQRPLDEKPLGLVVSITQSKILVWSDSGRVGTLQEPHKVILRESESARVKGMPAVDMRTLNSTLYSIAERWRGKERVKETYSVVLMPDGNIPYGAIIEVIDAMRCKLPPIGELPAPCTFPQIAKGPDGQPIKKANGHPLLVDSHGVDLPKSADGSQPYDPDSQALFHDILFSGGFE